MRGLLKHKSAGLQLLILVSITLVSMFFIGALLGTAVMSAITGVGATELIDPKTDYTRPAMITYMRGMLVFQFISLFLVPSLLCARLFSTDSKKYLGLKPPSHLLYYGVGIAVMLVAIPLSGFLGELNKNVQFPPGIESWAKAHEQEAGKQIEALVTRHTIQDLILNLIGIAVFAAVGEELLFRGVAQRLLIKMVKSPWAGIIIAAFLFSAMHFQFYGFLPRFLLGILLGVIYWYSGSLWTAILAHFVYDAVLIILVYFQPETLHQENVLKASNLALIAAVSFALVAYFVWMMKKRSTVSYQEVYADDAIPVKDHPF